MVFEFALLTAFLGMFIGSFLNVVVARINTKKSPLQGRSECPNCAHTLEAMDLMPVLSFVLLQGRCRYCHQPISWQYPLVELGTAAVFGFIGFYFFNNGVVDVFDVCLLLSVLFVFSTLIFILVYDFLNYTILDVSLLFLGAGAVLYHLFNFLVEGSVAPNDIFTLLGAAVGTFFAFFVLFSVSQGSWIGGGDVKFVFLMGLLLGFPNILAGLFIAFVSGAVVGVALMGLARKSRKDRVPFAPFLVVGLFAAFFYAEPLIDWYQNMFIF